MLPYHLLPSTTLWKAQWHGKQQSKVLNLRRVLRQAEAHLNLANMRLSIQEDQESVAKKTQNVTILEQSLRGATHLLKVGGEDKSLTGNVEELRAQLSHAKATVANATTRLEESRLAERSAEAKFALAQEGERAVRKKAEETLRLYVSESRATLALEKVEEAESLKLAMDDETKNEAEREAEVAATGSEEGPEPSITAGTGSTGASGATGATAVEIEAAKIAAKAKKKAAIIAAERNASMVVETPSGHNIDATGAAANKRISEELKKQRMAKAAKAAQLAAEAIDGPRADDSKTDEELHALREAENKTANIIEKVERSTRSSATGGNGVFRTATGVASAAQKNMKVSPKAPFAPSGATGATGIAWRKRSNGSLPEALTPSYFFLAKQGKASQVQLGHSPLLKRIRDWRRVRRPSWRHCVPQIRRNAAQIP